MTFPDTPLDIITELFIDGAWTNVSGDVYNRDPVHITRGRADESSAVDPSSCTLTLNNRGGKYSPRNPNSPLFGKIGRNTPVRVSVGSQEQAISLKGDTAGRATTPSAASLDLSGDIDVRWDMRWAGSTSGGIAGRWNNFSGSWWLGKSGDGFGFDWTNTSGGSNAWTFSPLTIPLPDRVCFRLTTVSDSTTTTGSLYWGTSIEGPWSLIDAQVATTPHPIANAALPLSLGVPEAIGSNFTALGGDLYRVQVRDGVGGPVLADADLTSVPAGSTSFTDLSGNPFTVTAPAEIVSRPIPRFTGEVSAWPLSWDSSGADSWVSIEAAGIMRRLGQGQKATESAIHRRISSQQGLLGYWPMEDVASTSDQKVFSPVPGAGPMRTADFDFSQASDLVGSSPLPVVGAEGVLRAEVPPPLLEERGNWRVSLWCKVDSAPSVESTLLWVHTVGSTFSRGIILLRITAAGWASLGALDNNGDNFVTLATKNLGTPAVGQWVHLTFAARQLSDTTCDYEITLAPVGGDAEYLGTNTLTGVIGSVTELRSSFDNLSGVTIGHIAAYSRYNVPVDGNIGHYGETAYDRVVRVSGEDDVPMRVVGNFVDTPQMGYQPTATILDVLQEAADADGGLLGETPDAVGLWYRANTSVYNQYSALTLDYAAGDVPDLSPVDGDESLRNDVTVERVAGGFAREIQTDGPLAVDAVGRYDESVSLNLFRDEMCASQASWRVHLGTWNDARYPVVDINLARSPHLIKDFAHLELLSRITVTNPPAWLPPVDVDLLVQGYSETLSLTSWDVSLNCTPYGPFKVATLGADIADTSNSTVAAASETDTVLTVSGDPWTTDPADFPLGVLVNGESITVTAVSGTASPQTFTVIRSVNGVAKPIPAGSDLRLAHPAIVAL